MFSFFKKETHSELEQILTRLHLNASNNYRDATKEDLEELKKRYAELMDAAWTLLRDDGELSVVVPFDYRQRMEDEATFVGFFPCRVCAVRTAERKPAKRFLLAFRQHPCPCERTEITLGDEAYTQLTQEFYL